MISPAPVFAYRPGYRESALRASRAAVGRPQRRAGLGTGSYAPKGPAELDYEREKALFQAVSGQDVAFDSCDLGTFQELKEKVSEYRPLILHLTGHGMVRDGKGHFAFEREDGTADLIPADELRRFLSGSGVQCVFI